MSIQILFPHVTGLSFYCLVERDFPLCILDISLLSDICVCVSHSVMSDSLRPYALKPARLLCPWNFPGKNTGEGSHSLLQGIFPTQGSNLLLLHCRQILYHLIHQGNGVTKRYLHTHTQNHQVPILLSFLYIPLRENSLAGATNKIQKGPGWRRIKGTFSKAQLHAF